MRLDAFDARGANDLLDAMSAEARAVVEQGAAGAALQESRLAYMRYVGQGHEITVELPDRPLVADDRKALRKAFDEAYSALYGQTVPGMEPEILSWTLTVSTAKAAPEPAPLAAAAAGAYAEPKATRELFDPAKQDFVTAGVFERDSLEPGARVAGPALIVEAQTTTVVTSVFDAAIDSRGYIVLTRK